MIDRFPVNRNDWSTPLRPRKRTDPVTTTPERTRPGPPSPVVVLSTKLRVPVGRQALVRRPGLLALLAADPTPRLTLVGAPPGWGKTTLLAAWATGDKRGRRFGWLSLDDADNDPARFGTYLVEALRLAAPGIGEAALALLRVPGKNLVADVLPPLVNELVGLPGQAVLVLDDYHLITEPAIHAGVTFLLERLPETLRLVVAARADPPLPLARLRARGELLELRAGELRFGEGETAALLNDIGGLGLGAEDIARLHRRTEGWAAGLHLAALLLRGHGDPRRFVASFAGDDRHIVDYLGAEVLDRQSDVVRGFLLRTAVLGRLSGPLCDAVTGRRDSARLLEEV
jgi:LuxR family transcriptional regulator, maltose regulon positive regulatory protein